MRHEAPGQWIGEAFTSSRIAAMLLLGAVGVISVGVQPALYGALERAGRISIGEIGAAATAEMLMLALGVSVGGVLGARFDTRKLAALSTLALIAVNLATIFASGVEIVAVRAVAGLPAGVLVWVSTAMIVRSPWPARLAAASLLSQTFLQLCVAALAAWFAPGSADAVPAMIALFALGALALTGFTARRFAALSPEPTSSGLPTARGWLVLIVITLLQFSLVGAWIFVELIGTAAGLAPEQVALATPLSLAAQMVGGVAALMAAGRLHWVATLTASGLALAGSQVLLAQSPGPQFFLALALAYGFIWNFSLPALTPLAIDVDPTRRVAQLAPAAMLAGAALGPMLTSVIADIHGPRVAVLACTLPALGCAALVVALHLFRTGPAKEGFALS